MYAMYALATDTHRFLQRLPLTSVSRYHHSYNADDEQDHSRSYTSNGASRMIAKAKSLYLVQHTYHQRDNAYHNNSDV